MKRSAWQYAQDAPMDVYPARMTAKHARQARDIGNTNFSEGVRTAIEFAHHLKTTNHPAWLEWIDSIK